MGWEEMRSNGSNSDDERNLLLAFLRGDPDAARSFFERYGGIIRYAVNKVDITTPVIGREDLFQDTICYLLENDKKVIRDFKGKCKFSTYLYIICRRYAMRKARKYNNPPVEGEYALPEELPAPLIEETEAWDEEQKRALLYAIKQLDEDSQLFVRLMFYDNKSALEIMKIFGWSSLNSVYSKKNKIINKLREII